MPRHHLPRVWPRAWPRARPRAWPRVWLVTDPRQGEALWTALARLPRGSGVLFRDEERPAAERRALFVQVRAVARRRRLTLIVAGDARLARAWRADGWHAAGGPREGRGLLRTAPAHDRRELAAARRSGAVLVFVSPVHATRTHPGAPALGPIRFGLLIARRRDDIIALGGMNIARARTARRLGVKRWAAIDGLTPGASPIADQKRNAVPM